MIKECCSLQLQLAWELASGCKIHPERRSANVAHSPPGKTTNLKFAVLHTGCARVELEHCSYPVTKGKQINPRPMTLQQSYTNFVGLLVDPVLVGNQKVNRGELPSYGPILRINFHLAHSTSSLEQTVLRGCYHRIIGELS